MKDDNILIFPQSRCRSSQANPENDGSIGVDSAQYGLRESEVFLARLLHNIAEQFHLDPYYASQSISPYIPGLHSLVETVLNYSDSPYCSAEQLDIINQLLAETLVNSFHHAQYLAHE